MGMPSCWSEDLDKEVLDTLLSGGTVDMNELAERLGVKVATVFGKINALRQSNNIKKFKRTKDNLLSVASYGEVSVRKPKDGIVPDGSKKYYCRVLTQEGIEITLVARGTNEKSAKNYAKNKYPFIKKLLGISESRKGASGVSPVGSISRRGNMGSKIR